MFSAIKRVLAALAIGGVLAVSGLLAEALVEPAVAMAQASAAPPVGRLENKLAGVKTLLDRIGVIGIGIAVLFVGFKFLTGDPHAWRFAVFTVIGAAIIFGSAEMVTWLQS
jgi:type IV secretory pathway VirB2 component (pilin)